MCFRTSALILLLVAGIGSAQERPGRLPSDLRKALVPGLRLTVNETDARVARLPALLVPEGEPPTPFFEPGPFSARFNGYIKLRLGGPYVFRAVGNGSVSLKINNESVFDEFEQPKAVELVKGYNKIQLDYASSVHVDDQLRLYWKNDEFDWEPVPPTMLLHDGRDDTLLASQARRRGRFLFARLNCTACHALPLSRSGPAMPELARTAPDLNQVGERLTTGWMAQWIADPKSLRNHTTMPKIVTPEQARDIATFLTKTSEGTNPAGTDQGAKLFEERGCIACHRFTPPQEEDLFDRASLHFVGAKFKPGNLSAFLANPRKHHPWSRMPDLHLNGAECDALAAFLRETAKGKVETVVGDAAKGETLFAETGCANCHALGSSKPIAKIAMATPGLCKRAAYTLPDSDQQALTAFLSTDLKSLDRRVPTEFAQRQWTSMKCAACHNRDGKEALYGRVLMEAGSELEAKHRPDLTWAGEKLKPAWAQKLLAGQIAPKPRPYLKMHMPALPARGDLLAVGLSHEHGFAVNEDPVPEWNEDLAKVGEKVAAIDGGLGCKVCHAIGDQKAIAPFEAPGTNFSETTKRLRYDYFHRWMRNPPRLDPQTKMVPFAQDGKKTGLDTIYEGDARKQFEAVWHYLDSLK